MAAVPDAATLDAMSDVLLQKLLPSIHAIIEDIATRAACRALQVARETEGSSVRQGSTQLGVVEPGRIVTVDWTFTNSGAEPWPVGTGLRCLGGSMEPAPESAPAAGAAVAIPPGGQLTVQAAIATPQAPGPCESMWQLEGPSLGGARRQFSPQLLVQGMVAGGGYRAMGGSCGSRAPALSAVPAGCPAAAASPAGMMPIAARAPIAATVTAYATAPAAPAAASIAAPAAARPVPGPGPVPIGVGGASPDWRQGFEEFFGPDSVSRLRQDEEKERNRMVNQVWEYVRRTGGVGNNDMIVFDASLSRVFTPFVQNRANGCYFRDLLTLVQMAAAAYLQGG